MAEGEARSSVGSATSSPGLRRAAALLAFVGALSLIAGAFLTAPALGFIVTGVIALYTSRIVLT